MGDCSSNNCNPCGPDYNAINQLAVRAGAYARQANTYSVDAQNAWLEFNALYLGAFASAPTVDNEGSPLQTGALYWNSVSNTLFAWNGTAWAVATNFNEFTPFLATGTTTARNLVTREADVVNVKDFGAVGDGVTDDSSAFIAAIAALSSDGGEIQIPAGNYVLNTNPLLSVGTKSIYWNISTGCVFSGSGTGSSQFPYMTTNQFQLAVGPFIQSRTSQTAFDGSGFPNVGVAAFNVEMLQPTTYNGQSVGIYVGAEGSNPSVNPDLRLRGNTWAINSMVVARPGAKGFFHNIEADINNFANPAGDVGGLHKLIGIAIQGIGDYPVHVGLEIARTPYGGQTYSTMPKYIRGIQVFHSTTGIEINTTVDNGIVIHNPDSSIQSAGISAKMLSNGADIINLQRYQDSSSAGYFLRCVNAANNVNLFTINQDGGIDSQSYFIGQRLEMFGTAAPASAGIVSLGNDVLTNTIAMPTTPPAYWWVYYGGTQYKIPLFL